jgi:hypothetical protein
MGAGIVVRNSLPQDVEPILRGMIQYDKEKFDAGGYSGDDVGGALRRFMSGGQSFTVSDEEGAIGYAFGLFDTIGSCDKGGKKMIYMPFWMVQTTKPCCPEPEFWEEFAGCLDELEKRAMGLPIAFWAYSKNASRMEHLRRLGFEMVEGASRPEKDFVLFVRKKSPPEKTARQIDKRKRDSLDTRRSRNIEYVAR